jgi:hypothetical protein
MKIISIIAAIVLMSSNSCGDPEPFDAADGKRSFVSGRILDEQGNGIVDYGVEILSNFDTIGRAITDSNGFYETTIIESIYGLRNIKVQPLVSDRYLTNFNLTYSYELPQSNRSFAFRDITLRNRAGVTFEIENNSGSPFNTRTVHNLAWCNYEYQEDVLNSTNCFELTSQYSNSGSNTTIYVPFGTVFTIQITRDSITTNYDYIIDQEDYEILLTI